MKKFGLRYIVRNAIFISTIIFAITFISVSTALNYIYDSFGNRIENTIQLANHYFKNDYYNWIKIGLSSYGKGIIDNNLDELNFYTKVVISNISVWSYDIAPTSLLEDVGDYIVSTFYWDGRKIYSFDENLPNQELLKFLKNTTYKPGQEGLFISSDKSVIIYLFKLREGIIGAKIYPEFYNKIFLRNILLEAPMDLYINFSKSLTNIKFVEIIDGIKKTINVNLEKEYLGLMNDIKNTENIEDLLEVKSKVIDDIMFFFVTQNYGDVIFNLALSVPLRSIFPLMSWELSLIMSLPILIITFLLIVQKTRKLQEAYDVLEEKDRIIQMELDIASVIQKNIMPIGRYKWSDFYFVGYSQPMGKIGGDFFDIFPIPGGRMMFYIADVSGHGIPAALITTMLKISLVSIGLEERNPSRALAKLNERIRIVNSDNEKQILSNYLTIFLAIADREGNISYACGGHYNPIVYNTYKKQFREIPEVDGPIVGILEPSLFVSTTGTFKVEK
ncbi:MAG: SpoIIE family protein phosphatase, partial [Spirochaetia bacterium]|nr:serine/threonine-protein phosphatase [Spirochaetota bacterium]MDW8113025.1 SpoIIE family protein phosphatase [Spirochaetia bacterium]